jgi:hypothetical protein
MLEPKAEPLPLPLAPVLGAIVAVDVSGPPRGVTLLPSCTKIALPRRAPPSLLDAPVAELTVTAASGRRPPATLSTNRVRPVLLGRRHGLRKARAGNCWGMPYALSSSNSPG